MRSKLIVGLFLALSMACSRTKESSSAKNNQVEESIDYSGAPTIVYKTKGDYYNNVPVTLSADKSKIIAYPGVKDIYYQGTLSIPSRLTQGYLLDNRGINEHSVFLTYSYEDYSRLKEIPALDELYNSIIDKDPFVEIYNLGNRSRFKEEVDEINMIIEKGDLKKFKKIM